jgi:hypothetical protein
MVIGPWALTTLGAVTVAAPAAAAPTRNLRRVAVLDVRDFSVVMIFPSMRLLAAFSEPLDT